MDNTAVDRIRATIERIRGEQVHLRELKAKYPDEYRCAMLMKAVDALSAYVQRNPPSQHTLDTLQRIAEEGLHGEV